MSIYQYGEHRPRIEASAWVAPGAQLIGQVALEEHASVWFGAVLRGDNELIHIGARSNVQENAVLHTDAGVFLTVGENVTIGHQAMLHGCTIGDGTLIGIQAIILNRAVIGRNSLVAAGAVVTEDKQFPDGALILGAPAKVARMLTDEEKATLMHAAEHYVQRKERFRQELRPI